MIQYKLTNMNGIFGLEISRVMFIDGKKTLTLKIMKGGYSDTDKNGMG